MREYKTNVPMNGWNPSSSHDWAKRFGFVASPLFPPSSIHAVAKADVLRDGRLLSFTLLGDGTSAGDRDALSWSWSAHTRYLLVPRPEAGRLSIFRWDQPSKPFEELALGGVTQRPAEVMDLLRRDRPAREQDAIDHVIQVFRSLRSRVADSETAIRLLHRLLRPYDDAAVGGHQPGAWARADVIALRDRLLSGNTRLGLPLHPDLLLRHAAAELFQEAHVEADRQIYFFGMSPPARIDKLPPEVRYTPAHLARVLGEVAFSKLDSDLDRIRVLDPACGSGVFLTEVEPLLIGGHRPRLELRGYDTSSVAVELAQSSIRLAASADQAVNVEVEIKTRDSLTEDWATADVILMNPPFRAYPDMDRREREAAKQILGNYYVGRPDKALSFLWKAWLSLSDGGLLAAVLPAGVLTGEAGRDIRRAIQREGTIHVIGRFENHTFFRHSLIETGFIVVQKAVDPQPTSFIAVVAAAGAEDDAIRSLRLLNSNNEAGETDDVYRLGADKLAGTDWFPRRRVEYDTIADVLSRGFPTADQLFTISQGMRTGLKQAFVLTKTELMSLPERERSYFRPAAGQGTIRDGCLYEDLYAFYPYAGTGVRIGSEEELINTLHEYTSNWLLPVKDRLSGRKKIEAWYLPTWPRNWQFIQEPKLVSTYFGQAGSFAVDTAGKHVVVDGHVWMPKRPGAHSVPELTKLLQAYCALLNSAPFQDVLRIHARSITGGYIRLEPRFINAMPLPDLRQATFERVLLPQLASLGEQIAESGLARVQDQVDRLARTIYGL